MQLSAQDAKRIGALEQILDYHFSNPELLLAAVTHPSAQDRTPYAKSYERLEFLGDSVLGALVATEAFHRFPNIDEGGLTRIKTALVSGQNLSAVAQDLGIARYIIFGSSEYGTNKRGLTSALENVYEALIAALYLDGGFVPAQTFVAQTLLPMMNEQMATVPDNPKGCLQERLQACGLTPSYELLETQGPPHDRIFFTQVKVGNKILAKGEGRSKKLAESKAALNALASWDQSFE